ERRPFTAPRDFTCLENHGAAIGDKNRVVSVQRIETCTTVGRKIKNLGAGLLDQIRETPMVLTSTSQFGWPGVAKLFPLIFDLFAAAKCLVRSLHDDAPEARHHALATD